MTLILFYIASTVYCYNFMFGILKASHYFSFLLICADVKQFPADGIRVIHLIDKFVDKIEYHIQPASSALCQSFDVNNKTH